MPRSGETGSWSISDEESTNGGISDGDKVKIGQVEFYFRTLNVTQ
jgi:hypothetical protein